MFPFHSDHIRAAAIFYTAHSASVADIFYLMASIDDCLLNTCQDAFYSIAYQYELSSLCRCDA